MERPASKLILAAMFFAASAGLAMAQNYDYLSRSDFVSLSSGDSSRANIAIQTETPWPVYLNNVTIPGNSNHAISALEQLSNSFKAQSSSPSTVINVGTTGQ